MAKYKIYGGMAGGFNSVDYQGTFDCKDYDDAVDLAYQYAVEDYQSYEGSRGVMDYSDCLEECDGDEEEARELYMEEIISWIDFYVERVEED